MCAITLSGCKGGEIMGREFNSMTACLSSMKSIDNGVRELVSDKPDDVSGFLSDGRSFGCEVMTTGTKGTYVQGWYDAKK